MIRPLLLVMAALLIVLGLTFVGCHNDDAPIEGPVGKMKPENIPQQGEGGTRNVQRSLD